jgi:hypothetical protein
VEKETARGTEFSRREMLGVTAAGVVAGATAVGMFGEGAAAASVTSARRTARGAPVAMVRRHLGSNVEVVMTEGTRAVRTVPVHGFPDGWQLRSGDLVWLRKPQGAATEVASPLVRPVSGAIAGRPEAGKVLRIADSEALVSEHTINQVQERHPDAATPYVAQLVDNAAGRRPVCLALKPDVEPLRG